MDTTIRRASLRPSNIESPDSVPRRVARKTSDDGFKSFPSMRIIPRRESTRGTRKERSKSLFSFPGSKSTKSIVDDTGKGDHGHRQGHPEYHSRKHMLQGYRGESWGEMGESTQGLTDRDDDIDDFVVRDSERGKDKRQSLQLHSIFASSSRRLIGRTSSRHCSKSSGNNSSLLSSLSSAFSSFRGSIFVFHTTLTDENLENLPPYIGDDTEELTHNYHDDGVPEGRQGRRDSQKFPPKYPSRRDSFQSCHSACSHSHSSFNNCSSPSGILSVGVDGQPRRPKRRSSYGTQNLMIAAIAEVENEVEHAGPLTTEDTLASTTPERFKIDQSITLSGVFKEAKDDVDDCRLHHSAPNHKVGISPDMDEEILRIQRTRRRSAPIQCRGSHNFADVSEELPFPIRQESIQSLLQQSGSRSPSKIPASVPPEATILEKKSLLRRTLHFPKQKLGAVLRRVASTPTNL